MTLIDDLIKKMRDDSSMLHEMCGVYPGDPDYVLSADAYLLDKAAGWLERINWTTERELFLENTHKVEVQYSNDNALHG